MEQYFLEKEDNLVSYTKIFESFRSIDRNSNFQLNSSFFRNTCKIISGNFP